MRVLLALALAASLTACGGGADPAGDARSADDYSEAGDLSGAGAMTETGNMTEAGDVSAAGSMDTASGSLTGDWVHCSGPTPFDTSFTVADGQVRSYIQDRPGMVMSYSMSGGDLVLEDDTRYGVAQTGSVLTVGGDAVYARTAADCP